MVAPKRKVLTLAAVLLLAALIAWGLVKSPYSDDAAGMVGLPILNQYVRETYCTPVPEGGVSCPHGYGPAPTATP